MTLSRRIDDLLGLVLAAPRGTPAPHLPRRLDALFRDLRKAKPSRPAEDLQDLIWALWISHTDLQAEEAMASAIEAMAAGELGLAQGLLDHLVETHPDWAEAWNKRATLAFIAKRDADSLDDLARTLEIEPRHFGAVSGFGQICLRNGRLGEARAAFQVALALNPHLRGLAEMAEELRPEPATLH